MLVCSLRITGQKGRLSTSEMNVPIQNTDDNIPTVCFEVFKMNVPVIDMHMQCFIFQFYSMLLTGSSMSGAFSPTWEMVPGGMLFPKQQPFYSTKKSGNYIETQLCNVQPKESFAISKELPSFNGIIVRHLFYTDISCPGSFPAVILKRSTKCQSQPLHTLKQSVPYHYPTTKTQFIQKGCVWKCMNSTQLA